MRLPPLALFITFVMKSSGHTQHPIGNRVSQSPRMLESYRRFDLDGVRYLALQTFEHTELPQVQEQVSLVTIVPPLNAQAPQEHDWHAVFKEWADADDVFRTSFLRGLIFVSKNNQEAESHDVPETLRRSWNTSFCLSLSVDSLEPNLPFGPHLLDQGKLFSVYRLYDDVNGAFIMGTMPYSGQGPFRNLGASGDFYRSLSISVPPRKPPHLAGKGPLDGLRFAVKDIFDIEGLRRTAGNRAFYSLSKPAPTTAPLLQRLIDSGAHLVGTLTLGSLIAREEPTEAVDFHAPFNPRGDGYQSAWSSSGGSGAAIASYDWLDFSIGSDTTGSSRRPALANGCFQIRLSQDALPLEGMLPSYSLFDAPALFGRDIARFESIVGAWTGQKQPDIYEKLPVTILYIADFFPVQNQVQMDLINKFIIDFEQTYGVKQEKLSLAAKWKEAPPKEAENSTLNDFLKDVGLNSFVYGLYHELDEFREEYNSTFHQHPYVNPVTRWRWDAAKKISKAQHEKAVGRLKVYKKWLLDEVLQEKKRNTLVIQPITNQAIDYREDPPDAPSAPSAFDAIWLAPILGAPEITIPIGEMEYHSRVSGKTEYLPILVSLLGSPGSDITLIKTTEKLLKASHRPTYVYTGSRMFGNTSL